MREIKYTATTTTVKTAPFITMANLSPNSLPCRCIMDSQGTTSTSAQWVLLSAWVASSRCWPHLRDSPSTPQPHPTWFHTQGDGGWQIGHQNQEQNLQGRAHHGDANHDADEDLHHLTDGSDTEQSGVRCILVFMLGSFKHTEW